MSDSLMSHYCRTYSQLQMKTHNFTQLNDRPTSIKPDDTTGSITKSAVISIIIQYIRSRVYSQ